MENGDVWTPLTDAERKVLEARRERTDKICKIMGDYLLKGYKMLGDICGTCETILMEDRRGNKYCIACSEVDTTENIKDNPVLSEVAARRLVEESQYTSAVSEQLSTPLQQRPRVTLSPLTIEHGTTEVQQPDASPKDKSQTAVPSQCCASSQASTMEYIAQREVNSTLQSLQDKMTWASRELVQSQSIETSIQLCNLIKVCAEAMAALGKAMGASTSE